MKTILFYLILSLFPLSLAAQSVPAHDAKLVDDYLRNNLTSTKVVVGPAAVSKVFSGNFYIVNAGYNTDDGVDYSRDLLININADALVMYEQLTTDKEMPSLKSLVKKGFLLKDEAAAKLFEAALNELYPVQEDKKAGVKHIKKNNQWIFLRSKFFDDQTAVIVTTDAKGTITKIEVKLSYPGA